MGKLKLGLIADDKPVRLTIELPAEIHRDLGAYAEVLATETGQAIPREKLIPHMVARFMATDRGFAKTRRDQTARSAGAPSDRGGQRNADRSEPGG